MNKAKTAGKARQLLFRGNFWKEVRRNPEQRKKIEEIKNRQNFVADMLIELYDSTRQSREWLKKELKRRNKSLVDIAETKANLNIEEEKIEQLEKELMQIKRRLKLIQLKEKYRRE
jgi:hypothetical protein